MKKLICFLLILKILSGCSGGGTHGYIKRYRYAVTKEQLESAVQRVIKENIVIRQDSVKDYYNDDTNYVSIHIVEKAQPYSYTFHYYGGKEYWDTSATSAISIAYAYDKDRRGGSNGNGGVKWYNFSLKKDLIKPFEREFIDKIDKNLNVKHSEE